jgi:VWFA-related protein
MMSRYLSLPPRAGLKACTTAVVLKACTTAVVVRTVRCAVIVTAMAQGAAAQQQPPKFQSSVDVTSVDVSVVDDRGQPIQNLAPADFTVRIDGNPRRVVSAEWVSLVAAAAKAAPVDLPEGYSSNENAAGGRLIVLVVDEPNIRFGAALALMKAAGAFVDHLSPSDRIAAVGLGTGSHATAFIADRERIKRTISLMAGQKSTATGIRQYNVANTEALAMANGDRMTSEAVITRECASERTAEQRLICAQGVEFQASQIAQDLVHGADQTIRGLRDLLTALKAVDGSKTLILMSEGFVMDNAEPQIIELGALAAAARTSLYALQLDDQMFDITDSRAPISPAADRRSRSQGLELLAGAARGALFTIATSASPVFDRIQAELSGYYLLGVESDPYDSDGRPHTVRVDVPRRGAVVRARRQLLNASPVELQPRSSRQAVAASLGAPLLLSALPLRVATFALQGPERSKVQLLIHADIGTDYAASKRLSIGYVITDAKGQVVESQAADMRLAPAMAGVPSSLEYVAGASLAPGDYTLKLAVADGDKVGSIEHPIHAALVDAGSLKVSELMVGGPVDAGDILRPTIGYLATYGTVHGYLEAYGAEATSLKVTYEIATDDRSPAILNADVPARPGGDGRVLFTKVIVVRALPPGKYVLRAVMTRSGQPVTTLARRFEVAPPPVLMTSAAGLGDSPSIDGELFLPIEEATLAAPFRAEDALKPATLEPFRARLAPAAKEAFDKGLASIAAREWVAAERSLKAAIQPENDSTAALSYLAVCFAATGHDTEAASAWQTALVDGSDVPQIYQWLSEALMRTHDLAAARSVLEEASGRWPADTRFVRPLAMLFAAFGKGREAVRTLERYIAPGATGHADPDSLSMAVEWIYHVHAAGALVHNRAEDLKLARTYADQYAKTKGAKHQLVKQWLDFLEREKR